MLTIRDDADIYAIAIECLRKSTLIGKPEEIVEEFTKIYNSLKGNLVPSANEYVKRTVFDDYLVCLEDGKKMQMLKRHLWSKYNMTFEEYKKKWNLPIDYPYVCKNYSKVRMEIAIIRGKNKKKTDSNKSDS